MKYGLDLGDGTRVDAATPEEATETILAKYATFLPEPIIKGSEKNRLRATIRNILGILYAEQGKRIEATAEFIEQAHIYEQDGYCLRGIAILRHVLAYDPTLIHNKIAVLCLKERIPEEATRHFIRAAELYLEKNDLENAAKCLTKVHELCPDNVKVAQWLSEHGFIKRVEAPGDTLPLSAQSDAASS